MGQGVGQHHGEGGHSFPWVDRIFVLVLPTTQLYVNSPDKFAFYPWISSWLGSVAGERQVEVSPQVSQLE